MILTSSARIENCAHESMFAIRIRDIECTVSELMVTLSPNPSTRKTHANEAVLVATDNNTGHSCCLGRPLGWARRIKEETNVRQVIVLSGGACVIGV